VWLADDPLRRTYASAARLAFLVLALGACKHGTHADSATEPLAPAAAASSLPVAAPSALLPPQADATIPPSTPSYVTAWVDGTRASRTTAVARTLAPPVRLVALDDLSGPLAARPLGRVQHVLVAPDGEHVVVRGADAAFIFEQRTGVQVGSIPRSTSSGLTFVLRTAVFQALDGYDWTGAQGPLSLYVPGGSAGRVWATHVAGDSVFFIQQEPLLGNHDSRQPERLEIIGNHLVPGGPAKKLLGADILQATSGMGAISGV
jgi:hypothetical protein